MAPEWSGRWYPELIGCLDHQPCALIVGDVSPRARLRQHSRETLAEGGRHAQQRGSPDDPPMSHTSHDRPRYYVAHRLGDYSDAIDNKKLKVHMLLMESLDSP